MMQVRRSAFLLTAFFFLHVFLLQRAVTESKMLPAAPESGIVIPTPVLAITSLEFKGFVSDLLFIKALIFQGSTYERKEEPRMKPEEWQWLNRVLIASTDLDPYFSDPYFLANAHMTWEAGMVRETNELLEKGTQYRDWDWVLPFFSGFNNFFFLHDDAKAAELLMTASQRPGPSEQLLSLAARLAFKGKKTENAILFLEAIAKKTDDERQKKDYETRIRALRTRLFLERSVTAYKARFGRPPVSLQKLVETGVVKEIPQDPYGGKFFIDPVGEITGTSDYQLIPYQRQR
jgi:hypothetical protein